MATTVIAAAEKWHPRVLSAVSADDLDAAEKDLLDVFEHHLTLIAMTGLAAFKAMTMTGNAKHDADAFDRAMERRTRSLLAGFGGDIAAALEMPMELGGDAAKAEVGKLNKTNERWIRRLGQLVKRVFADTETPGINVDWTLDSPEAQAWIAEYAATLAAGLSATTREKIAAAILAGVLEGESIAQITARITAISDEIPTWRARSIAQTEVIHAYSQGAQQVYKASGVVKRKRWLDGQSGACPACSRLNNTMSDLDGTFNSDAFGEIDGPPAHPGCRCAIAPVLT